MGAGPDVRFDWDGSLVLARRLWAFADQLDEVGTTRRDAAGGVLTTWSGVFAGRFAERVEQETTDLARAATHLREGAMAWATAWKVAIDQQNRVFFARACERARADRSLLDRVGGWFTGHDDLPAEPLPREVPLPPHFVPSRGFARYQGVS